MYQSLSHSRWDCTYHVVFILKCRRKRLYGEIRKLKELDRGLKVLSGEAIDLTGLLFLGLVRLAIYQALQGDMMAPAVTLIRTYAAIRTRSSAGNETCERLRMRRRLN
jgi:hypothetical protein